jgi:hypothetical protein
MRKQGTDSRQMYSASHHAGALRCHGQPFRRRVHQHNGDDILRMKRGVRANDEAAKRVADQHMSLSRTNVREYGRQLVDDPPERAWAGGHIAPGKTRAVVRAHPGEVGDLGLYERPTEGGGGYAGFEQHHRCAVAETERMETVSTDVNQEAGRSNLPPTTSADDLIERANGYECNKNTEDGHILDR